VVVVDKRFLIRLVVNFALLETSQVEVNVRTVLITVIPPVMVLVLVILVLLVTKLHHLFNQDVNLALRERSQVMENDAKLVLMERIHQIKVQHHVLHVCVVQK